MKGIMLAIAVAAGVLAIGSSEASAWVCKAGGIGGTTIGRSWNIVDAKLRALRKCEHRSPVPVCTIIWCR